MELAIDVRRLMLPPRLEAGSVTAIRTALCSFDPDVVLSTREAPPTRERFGGLIGLGGEWRRRMERLCCGRRCLLSSAHKTP